MQGAVHALSWKRLADGRVHAVARAPLAPAAPAAWGDARCISDALTALAAASAAESTPRGARVALAAGAVYAVLDEALVGDGVCFIKRIDTPLDAGEQPPPLPARAAALGGFTGELPPPCALLLTHTFDVGAAGESEASPHAPEDALHPATTRITLTTLLARPQSDGELLRRTLLGDANVALPGDGSAITLLTINAQPLDAAALSAESPATRAAVRAAQKMQLLASTAAAIDARAGTPAATLMPTVARLRPALAEPLQALTTHVAGAYAAASSAGGGGGRPTVTRAVCDARTGQAEVLEAQGRFLEAAALYKQNLADAVATPGLLASPPMEWAYYGLALKRAGNLDAAAHAYAAGLRAAAEGPMEPDTPLWRESHRLNLRNLEITLRLAQGDTAAAKRAVMELFRNEARAAGGTVEPMWSFEDMMGGSGFLLDTRTGKGWELTFTVESIGSFYGLQVFRTRELAPSSVKRRKLAPMDEMRAHSGASHARQQAASSLKSSLARGASALPRLPPASCARCGVEAGKRCGACGVAPYCGAGCQRAHWAEHKTACNALRAAAPATPAGAH